MKLLIIAMTLISAHAYAQTLGKPFQLNPGKYNFECWSAGLVFEGIPGHLEAIRSADYSNGSLTVALEGSAFVEVSQSQTLMDGEYRSSEKSFTKTTISDLGNGQFKQLVEGDTLIQLEGDQQATTIHHKSEVILKVDGAKSQNILVTNNDQPQKAGVGEGHWMAMSDGRIVTQSYIREKTVGEYYGNRRETLVSNYSCIYTPQK